MAAEVIVRFLADTTQLNAQVAQVQGTGAKMTAWAKGVGAAIGAAFALDLVRDSINAASDLNEAVNQTRVIFGQASTQIERFTADAATGLGMSQTQALNAANTFATFGKSAGLAGKDLVGFSTEMTTLATDLASFKNTSPEEAITAIGAALRGESEPIRRYGVLLDEATLRARALKLGIVATTTEALTPQQRVLAAQAEILAQTSDAQGDFGRTSGEMANQQRILAAQFTEIQVAIGQLLLPILRPLVGVLSEVAAVVKDNVSWLGPLVEWAIKLSLVWMAMLPVLTALVVKWLNLGDVAQAVAAWIVGAWDRVYAFFTELPGKIGAALATVGGIIVAPFVWAWEQIKSGVDKVAGWFAELPGRIIGGLGDIGIRLYDVGRRMMEDLLDGIKSMAGAVLDKIKSVAGDAASALNPFDSPQTKAFYTGQAVMRDYIAGAQSQVPRAQRAFSALGSTVGYAAGSGGGGPGANGGNRFEITVNVAPGVSPAEVGAATVDAIRQYERVAGKAWRAA